MVDRDDPGESPGHGSLQSYELAKDLRKPELRIDADTLGDSVGAELPIVLGKIEAQESLGDSEVRYTLGQFHECSFSFDFLSVPGFQTLLVAVALREEP